MKIRLLTLILVCLASSCLHSQTMDDNVIINSCEDSYFFKEEATGNVVHNTRKTEYEALRMGAKIQPGIFYSEFITLDEAKTKGIFAPKAIHRNATPDNVFFDDTRVCYFDLFLPRPGKKVNVEFARTFKDLRYFTRIYFPEEYFIREKRIVITIPASLSRFRLVEKNFTSGIRCEKSVNKAGDSVFVYILNGVPPIKKESESPTYSYLYPHLLVTGSFADTQGMYQWLKELGDVDCTLPQPEALLAEVTAGSTTEMEKIRRTYAYVQQNIRYVAFENGIAGHQPDRPAEVLRKRYGDCKGMALLLRTLLKAQGFDARMAYTGTDDIACLPTEIPTLASINHAICLLYHQEKVFCLDATHRYLPLEAIPQGIQGREALVEDGTQCRIEALDYADSPTATDSLLYRYRLVTDNATPLLQGNVRRSATGENKEWLLHLYHNTPKEKQNDLLNTLLGDRRHNCQTADILIEEERSEASRFLLTCKINNSTAVQMVDSEFYIEPDPHDDIFSQPVDTTRRRQDYLLPWRCRIVREVSIDIPQGRTVAHLPANFSIETAQGILNCTYLRDGNCIVFRKEMEIRNKHITLAHIPAWNDALRSWKKACEEQIIIR